MSKVAKLLNVYREHIAVPWQQGLAGIQRVIFTVYDPHDELRMRANLLEFEIATKAAGHAWQLIDITDAFPSWMAGQRYRESYFETPEDLDGYVAGQISGFTHDLEQDLRNKIAESADANTVTALLGVGSLFGLSRVSHVVEKIADAIPGRLLVFFPGEYANNNYRLLDARDGWNYMAVPLVAAE
ncbi:MAG: DUF1788 domain-containing protein [Rhodocyclaceae bacterium]|nr:DUF1788 domain-containing protein [Rhodocyclaceae bacterium]